MIASYQGLEQTALPVLWARSKFKPLSIKHIFNFLTAWLFVASLGGRGKRPFSFLALAAPAAPS
jgi:hypothetical protein